MTRWTIVNVMLNPLFRYRKISRLACAMALACGLFAGVGHAQTSSNLPVMADYDRSSAVIFSYQRVGEDLYPANNLSVEQFSQQLQEMVEGDYNIAALPDIVASLQQGTALPDKTVALTFSGAYQSALKNAMPLLLERNIPFTVFFSPDQADGRNPEYIGWSDLKKLRRSQLVTLGLHPSSYAHLTAQPIGEIRRQVNNALTRYRQEFKAEPHYFAYPFGEYTKAFRNLIEESGFKAGFAQQSGVAYSGSDLFALPRFSMTENYGDEDRFRMAALALPLPVTDIAPDDPYILENNPPRIGFTLDDSLASKISQLSCYMSEHGKPDMQVIGKNRIELRVEEPFRGPRVRLNCTMPGPAAKAGEEQRWRWFGLLMNLHQGEDEDEGFEPEQAGPYPH